MEIERMLHEEIKSELTKLKTLNVGSDEYRTTVDGLTKLVDRAIEMDKMNIENQDKLEARADEKKDRWIRHALNALGIVIPAGVTVWGAIKSFKFEETGTITSQAGRGFFNRLFRGK